MVCSANITPIAHISGVIYMMNSSLSEAATQTQINAIKQLMQSLNFVLSSRSTEDTNFVITVKLKKSDFQIPLLGMCSKT